MELDSVGKRKRGITRKKYPSIKYLGVIESQAKMHC
jgi:hypothetical protein